MYEFKVEVTHQVKYLLANCGVRYWEDGTVNGVQDNDDNPVMPLKEGDCWNVKIDLETGTIIDWPEGTTAETHYKVCDAGVYALLDGDSEIVTEIEGYVPTMMCPEGSGYGDYVIMKIDGSGKIANWKVDFEEFEKRDD
jgi:hypothetical protein